ncbi:MAG: hypothetical protein DM484_24065 [Candidatus Methylumidiphilus alinenensis]|uniref:Peptidoglycan binding-like domain-containing protein n=1 Tax=Candidatus Methylumidiphilus alinenensis TaxID=2202197 RepID=A0A2W4QLN4_9GAMM|nr:MAG: hypothetical protein DM484_24065 [Candidatus Methylumidiphilus alinenensis]
MSELTNLPQPAESHANPFKAIALLLQSVRQSLEGIKNTGQAPRWVRIARIRGYQGETDYISKAVIPAVDKGLAYTILYLSHLTLMARDLLFQADAAKALVEVSGDMLKTVTTQEFSKSLADVVGQKGVTNPLAVAGGSIDTVISFVDKIPEPADLDLIGKELYGLLCVEQLPLDEAGLGRATESHLNITASGKLRLLQMALNKPITIRGLGKDKSGEQDITFLGGRRVWQAAELPAKALGLWGEGSDAETLYEFAFVGQDIEEANNLLEKLGYVEPAVIEKKVFGDALACRLRRFQKINELTVTGKLDNPSLNRLMHLNFDTKTLERAKPFDATQLPQGFDDTQNA